jgi:hypothetical protein
MPSTVVAFEDFQDRHAFDAFLVEHLLEDRGFGDAEPDPQPDANHDDAEEERNPPSPDEELVARQPAEEQHRQVRQEQSGRPAELRPGGEEAAIFVGARPLHRQQHRAAPLAADPNPLDQADDRQQDSSPNADALIGRHEPDGYGRDTGHQQCRDQGSLASDAVAPMAEDRRPNRAADKADEEDGERL